MRIRISILILLTTLVFVLPESSIALSDETLWSSYYWQAIQNAKQENWAIASELFGLATAEAVTQKLPLDKQLTGLWQKFSHGLSCWPF
jgi:hypothetical protein